jgi:hypothetical protein
MLMADVPLFIMASYKFEYYVALLIIFLRNPSLRLAAFFDTFGAAHQYEHHIDEISLSYHDKLCLYIFLLTNLITSYLLAACFSTVLVFFSSTFLSKLFIDSNSLVA